MAGCKGRVWVLTVALLSAAAMAPAQMPGNPFEAPAMLVPLATDMSREAPLRIGTTEYFASCDCTLPACEKLCPRGGLYAGGELVVLKPFSTEGRYLGFNYNTGYRVWGGYQNADGLGFQLRYFEYAQFRQFENYSTKFWDFEIADSLRMDEVWLIQFGGGLRYADFLESGNGDNFTGVGPVADFLLTRSLTCNLSLYGGLRSSILFGTESNGTPNDWTFYTIELSAGFQWNKQLPGGRTIFARGGWESQFTHGFVGNDAEGAGLLGGTFSVGMTR